MEEIQPSSLRTLDDGALLQLLDSYRVVRSVDPIVALTAAGESMSGDWLRTLCDEAFFNRTDPLFASIVIDLVSLRPDVPVEDILVRAAGRGFRPYAEVALISELAKRIEHIDVSVFLRFMSPTRDVWVRETAAQTLLDLGVQFDEDRLRSFFESDASVFVRLNLAAVLYNCTGRQEYYDFISNRCNDTTLEVAREARFCREQLLEPD